MVRCLGMDIVSVKMEPSTLAGQTCGALRAVNWPGSVGLRGDMAGSNTGRLAPEGLERAGGLRCAAAMGQSALKGRNPASKPGVTADFASGGPA